MRATPAASTKQWTLHQYLAISFAFLLAMSGTLAAQSRSRAASSAARTPRTEAAAAQGPCLSADGLDFGILVPGQSKSLPLRVCNRGDAELVFNDPWLTWVRTEFTVSPADIEKLKTARLGPGECVEITVTFISSRTGAFYDEGRFWSNSGGRCRNISIWHAIVTKPGPFISGYDWGERKVDGCADDPHTEYSWDIHAYNSGDRDFIVDHVVLVGADADKGYFRLDNNNPATTVARGDQIQQGDTTALRRLQRVIFTPEEARQYQCQVLLITEGTPPDTVGGFLLGRGIESHVAVYDLDFGNYQFVEPGSTIRESTTLIKSTRSTRANTITAVRLDNTIDFSITGLRRMDGTPAPLPFALSPDESVQVDLAFHPQTADPHVKEAHVTVEGDFWGCNDSVGMIRAGVLTAEVEDGRSGNVAGYALHGNTPNPVKGTTAISFTLGRAGRTTIEIFDERGSRVATPLDRELPAGAHTVPWSADGLPAGHYFYRITSGAWTAAKRIEHAE